MGKMFFKNQRHQARKRKGFTLVELLVVFFIMGSILAVILPDYLTYSTQLELENLALDVALVLREAQSYGAGVKVNKAGDSFNATYGLDFDLANPNKFYFFEENDSNDGYTIATDTLINEYIIKSDYSIADLCIADMMGTLSCKGNGLSDVRGLLVYFKRPNPDANIIRRDNDGTLLASGFGNAWIKLVSPDQKIATVHVTSGGGITIE